MTPIPTELRELLERVAEALESEIDARYGEGKTHPALARKYESDMADVNELRTLLATPPADAADMGGQAGEEVEVRGLQWLDTGHYRKKPPQFGYNPHDWNELCLVADAQRLLAERDARIESLMETFTKAANYLGIDTEQARKAPGKPSDVFIAHIDQLRARVGELEAKLAAPSFYWHDDENGGVESPEEWAEMQYGMTGEAFDSATLRCAIELPEREYDSIEFDAEGNCISIRYVGEVKAQPSGGKES